jgi:hypothetical protein
VFVELAARIEVDHVEHDMAAADDIERRVEDVLGNGHAVVLSRIVVGHTVIASEAKQSIFLVAQDGLLRRKGSSQ